MENHASFLIIQMTIHTLLDEGAKVRTQCFLNNFALSIPYIIGIKCFSKYFSISFIGIWLSKNK